MPPLKPGQDNTCDDISSYNMIISVKVEQYSRIPEQLHLRHLSREATTRDERSVQTSVNHTMYSKRRHFYRFLICDCKSYALKQTVPCDCNHTCHVFQLLCSSVSRMWLIALTSTALITSASRCRGRGGNVTKRGRRRRCGFHL